MDFGFRPLGTRHCLRILNRVPWSWFSNLWGGCNSRAGIVISEEAWWDRFFKVGKQATWKQGLLLETTVTIRVKNIRCISTNRNGKKWSRKSLLPPALQPLLRPLLVESNRKLAGDGWVWSFIIIKSLNNLKAMMVLAVGFLYICVSDKFTL